MRQFHIVLHPGSGCARGTLGEDVLLHVQVLASSLEPNAAVKCVALSTRPFSDAASSHSCLLGPVIACLCSNC